MERLIGIFALSILLLGTEAVEIKLASYNDTRNTLMEAEDLLTTGGRMHLNAKELKVDALFMKYKEEELARGFEQQETNAPAMHFFKAKPYIEQSKVFKLLKRMPKGANLHVHNSASVSSKWVVQELVQMKNLIRCVDTNGLNVLTFRVSKGHNCATQYVNVYNERLNSASIEDYDSKLEEMINLWTPYPELKYNTLASVWSDFQNMFTTIGDTLNYLPFFRAYHYQLLEELYNDNIMYAELRMSFKELYNKYGNTSPAEDTVLELINIVKKFKEDHPGFLGIKVIYSTQRSSTDANLRRKIDSYNELHKLFPNFVIGFDLVGQEDLGRTLYSLLSVLSEFPPSTPFFLHAGETNFYGSSSDFNLLDAVLLNTTRIGHGYALAKHPILAAAVKKRKIAIEVSPISNQVLHLVSDLRNHPASMFVAQNIPFVICNDDPGFWNAQGISYDYYYAIMSIAPNYSGLRTLKSLVWNSIEYSVLTEIERKQAFAILNRQWNKFIDETLGEFKFL